MSTPPLPARARTPRRGSPVASAAGSESSHDGERDSRNGNSTAAGYSGGGAGGGGDRSSGAVRVVVRVRPQNKKEIEAGGTICVAFPSKETIKLNEAEKTYDRVFDPSATQVEVFDYVAKPLVHDLFHGYNGTIFAYGQTSSGKTHTMEGPSIHDAELAGVIPRTVREIFFAVAEAPDSVEFVIKVSYIEIYMEKIRDLLDTYHTKVNLQVREDKQRGVYVAGATEEYVTSANELIAVMAAGAKNRVVAATGMNQGSSRSHSVFIISVQQRNVNDSSTKTGMLYLVDLAGSETVKKTRATGQVLSEAKTINKSLSALGQVIYALTDEKQPHVPYRDSKLTRVLQNSLGGNSKTCLIVNCSPSSFNEAETLSTLRFGSRAKRIQNKAIVNEARSAEELGALLAKAESAFDMQQTYIAALEKQLRALKDSGAVPPPNPPGPGADAGDGEVATPGSAAAAAAGAGAGARPSQDEESANAIRLLTKRNHELQAELEEEKAEVKQREQVSTELRQVLQEKESHLNEMAGLVQELQKLQSARREAFLAEKGELEADLEAQRAHTQELTQRHKFEIEEQSLKMEKLMGENARLAEELQDLTGDDRHHHPTSTAAASEVTPFVPASPSEKEDSVAAAAAVSQAEAARGGSGSPKNCEAPSSSSAVGLEGGVTVLNETANAGDGKGGSSPEMTGVVASPATSSAAAAAAAASMEGIGWAEGTAAAEAMGELDFEALESAGAPKAAIAMVREREERWRERDAKLIEEQWRHMQRSQQSEADRERPAKRERVLRQRLEQLANVHKNLLRKYGERELENAAMTKTLRHREGRIDQLEHDIVEANSKLKSQKEENSKNLLAFGQKVALLEREIQRQKLAPASHSHLERRAVRGGGGSHIAQEVKTLRGGNGRRSHDETRPWGGLGFDVKSNTYVSESGVQIAPDDGGGGGAGAAAAAVLAWASPGGRRNTIGGTTPRKGVAETSPGESRRTRLIFDRLLGGGRVVTGMPNS